MGASHGDFIKYPRTPHLFGSKGTDDDKHLGEVESMNVLSDDSLIVEEKLQYRLKKSATLEKLCTCFASISTWCRECVV